MDAATDALADRTLLATDPALEDTVLRHDEMIRSELGSSPLLALPFLILPTFPPCTSSSVSSSSSSSTSNRPPPPRYPSPTPTTDDQYHPTPAHAVLLLPTIYPSCSFTSYPRGLTSSPS
ncbi:hypothetical protein B296_00039550 [Ensete ventricosum]|uniref:Uncharacterized protein n=1 Tax=Ensete ventricosum TaxID=4639 RepID=A0A426YPI6_ENSVE|nr:hypothetical protein B296_00039550 [Ensete ventricosum]